MSDLARSIRIPELDGVRGISISLVVIGHWLGSRLLPALTSQGSIDPDSAGAKLSKLIAGGLADRGVDLFFVVSGYIITHLLIREKAELGRVSLSAFYVRRICRIMPAYVVYVIGIVVADQWQLIQVSRDQIASAVLFTCNLPGSACGWWLGHSWSLAVEQQFYLAWPLIFTFLKPDGAPRASIAVLVLIGFSSFVITGLTPFFAIATGIVIACYPDAIERYARSGAPYLLAPGLFLLSLVPYLLGRYPIAMHTLELIAQGLLAVIFVSALARRGAVAQLASFPAAQAAGKVSYSLYLWQQLFVSRLTYYTHPSLLSQAGLMFPFAVASYFLIERPGVKLGHIMSNAIVSQGARAKRVTVA